MPRKWRHIAAGLTIAAVAATVGLTTTESAATHRTEHTVADTGWGSLPVDLPIDPPIDLPVIPLDTAWG
ncbi:hypothetical protein [Streptomyces sp. NBC_01483]|uniref:hypothetical protein n=1 Tax=Streptomyces sp. NBC_01483 TaxID=2903883 RepID=UPI002E31A1C0|nr:hypothetical protein [Streptomyces sp. NBC_01483]